MRQRIFTLFSVLSLLVGIAAVVLCVRNWRPHDFERLMLSPMVVNFRGSERIPSIGIESYHNVLRVFVVRIVPPIDPRWLADERKFAWTEGFRRERETGVDFSRGEDPALLPTLYRFTGVYTFQEQCPSGPGTEAIYIVGAPCWLVAVVCAIPMALRLREPLRRRSRRRRGCCLTCGYDLRSSIDRCPECGMVAATPRGSGATAARPAVHRANSLPERERRLG